MPLTVRKFNAQVKDPDSGQMIPAGLLSSDSLQAIEAAETAAVTEIQQKGVQTRESIPDDYTALSDEVDGLKTHFTKNILYATTNTDELDWRSGYRVNSTGKAYTGEQTIYAALKLNDESLYLYNGSSITIKSGYMADYSIVDKFGSGNTKLEGSRNINGPATIVVSHTGYLLLSVTDGETTISSDDNAKQFAKNAIEINLYNKTVKQAIEKKLDRDQGIENYGKIMMVGNEGQLSAEPLPVDTTFQKSGVPADAKTVGDNLLVNLNPTSINFVIGGFNAAGTINNTYTTQIRTQNPIPIGSYGGTISCDEGYEIRVFIYSSNSFSSDGLIDKTDFTTEPVKLPTNRYIGVSIRNIEPVVQTDITNSEHIILDIPKATVKETLETLLDNKKSAYNHGPYDLYSSMFNTWYSGMQSDYLNLNRDTTYADIITLFDTLVSDNGDYITKNALLTINGTSHWGDNYSYTIYEYVFKPKHYSSALNTKKIPKIYMDGSIHGFEKCSTFGLYFFLKDIVEHWSDNESLKAIRENVEIHVIPVTNPYGFDNNKYQNENNININRNFEHNGEWEEHYVESGPGSDENNGAAAFDQPESAMIRDWITPNENDIIGYLNLHTNGQWYASSSSEMNVNMTSNDRDDEYFNRIFRIFTTHINEQTHMWPEMYDNIILAQNQYCGKIQSSATEESTKGTASAWGNTIMKMVSMTLEGFNGYGTQENPIASMFSAQTKKMNSENIGNMVIQLLREYAIDTE